METVESIEIDDEKQNGVHKIEYLGKQRKKTYSDYNAILIDVDFIIPGNISRKKKVITRKGYKKYQTIIKEKQISKILENEELQDSYNT